MTFKDHPLLSIFLCIALVITLLPLIGAIGPASATRGYIYGTVTAADYYPNSPPIRGITVFISRADGTYSTTLRTNESGMYQTGTIDDHGVGFTVDANKPDIAGYNARYESASYEDILFTATDRDGETRDFTLHGRSTSASTPTATPTPSPTPTPTQATPTATPTATATPDGSGDETGDAVEPASPEEVKNYGWIHGTIRKDDMHSGPVMGGITVRVIRKSDGAVVRTVTSNSAGYFNTGDPKLQDPQKQGMRVEVNKEGVSGYRDSYTTSIHETIYLMGEEGSVSNHMLKNRNNPSSGKVTLSVRVINKQGYLLGGIPVYFWRQDGQSVSVRTGSDRNDDANFGIAKYEVDKDTGSCGSGSKCYNIMANKWTDSGTNPNYFNSTEQRNVKPDYSKTVYITLPTSTVTLKGYVSADGKPIKGIVVYLWQHGGQAAWGPETNDKGEWSQVVPRWVWSGNDGREDHRIQIIANKPGTEYRYNAEYTTSEEISNVLPADDYTAKSLTLESKWVTLGGTVTRYDSVAKKDVPLKDIWVFFWRQDGKKAFHVQTDANGKYSAKVEKYRGDCKIPTSGCYNIAYNKDDKNYPDKPKNPNYDTKERSDVKPYNNWDTINQRLDPGSVKFSGKVTNTTHSSGVPNIWVSGKRLDNRASFLVQTDKDGKWSVQVEKFTEADHRFVVVANPSERSNPWYRNSTPETVQPNYDRTINPVLVVSRVTFSGKIYVSGAVAGNFPIIPITFERDDRAVTRYVNTRSDGTFTIQLDGCTSRYCTYTITANKGGPGYPKNTLYNTPAAITGKWSDRDQTSLSFTLTGGPVPTTTTPAPAPSITSVTPTEGGRSLTISNFIVTGTNFASGAKVKLTRSGSSDMTASVSSVTSTKITASFGIPSNAATGTWNVVVTNPDGKVATRTGAFTVKDVVSPLPNPNEMEVKDLNGEMISPTEFGIGMSVRYPAALPAATKRYVRVVATINGKRLDRTFDVTQYTSPGNVWSTQSGGQVSTATPLRFNLATEGVSKFSTDLPVPVSVTVSYDGETETKSASRQAEVRIPVIIFHGACPPEEYPHCTVKNGLIDPLLNYAGYEPLSIHLRSRGFHDGNGYRNLYAPGLTSAMYKHPQQAVPSDILNDVELKVADAKASSYSTRVNLVGHSFGGLVSQYYASQRPENVQKVITVGTPFKGITNIYNAMFSPKWNRAMVDANITTPGGQPNLLLWGVPKDYTAYTLPSNPPAGINVQVTNSYTYTPHSRVEYHYIYANNIDTDKTITLALNEEGTWYRSVSVSKAKGDGTVLVESGSNTPGPTGSNIFRHPVQVGSIEGSGGLLKTNHGSLMMDNLIHEEVMNAVDRGTPLWNTW